MQLHISQIRHRPWVFGLGAALMALVSTAQLPLTAGTPPSRPEHNPKFNSLDRPGMGRRGLTPRVNFGQSDAWVAKYKDQPITGEKRLLWKKQLGTSAYDGSNGVTTDSTGNIFISGYTYGDLGGSNQGGNDAWVAKYSPNGTLLWTKQLGTSAYDGSNGVATDSTGNVFISGYTGGNLGGSNQGSYDAWVAKYSPNGTLLWTKQQGSLDDDYSTGVATDNIGNVFISGNRRIGRRGSNAWVAKYSPDGKLLWTKQLASSYFVGSNGVATDSTGNVFISGGTYDNLGGINQGGFDAWVVKYSFDGTLLWKRQLGSSSFDVSYSVTTDSTGNVFISGGTDGNLGGSNQGGFDAWVAKYSSKGVLRWTQQLGTSSDDIFYSVATDSKGKVFISGYTEGKLGVINKGGGDAWVAQYTPNGLRGWVRQEGTLKGDYSYGVTTDESGNVVMTGTTNGNFSRD